MRKSKRLIISVIAILLSFIMSVSSSAAFDIGAILGNDPLRSFFTILNLLTTKNDAPAYMETPLDQVPYTESELARRQAIVDLVNTDLNKIKTQRPGFTMSAKRGLPGGGKESVESYFQQGSSIAGSIFQLLFGKDKNPVNVDQVMDSLGITSFFADEGTSSHERGADHTDTVSVSGQPFVSKLEAKDIYNENPITKSRVNDSYDFKIYLQDAIDPGPDSAQAKVFDLFSSVKLYQTLSSFMPQIDQNLIRLRYVDCYIQGTVDREGYLTRYLTHYKVIMQVDASQFDLDMTQYLDSINNKELYESEVIYYNFDWSERIFGDVNDDNKRTTADARQLLRIACRLEPQTDTAVSFGDMNFDGKITTADARILLRCVSNLQDYPVRPSA